MNKKYESVFILSAFRSIVPGATLLLLCSLSTFTVQAAPFKLGAYVTTLAAEDLPANVPAEARNNLVGNWKITFSKKNKFQVSRDDKIVIEGSFTVTTERLTLTDEKGDLACAGANNQSGTYRWSIKQKKLSLAAVSDNCIGRQFILTLRSWLQE